jgi:ABC-type glycerol-3-phosphate transport system permease component
VLPLTSSRGATFIAAPLSLVFATTTAAILPPLFTFFVFQYRMVSGIMGGGD